jgi:hypothetical protein
VDSHQQKTVKVEREGKMKQKPKPDAVSIHHNVQSINNKLLELDHDQSNKKRILNKQTKNTFTVFHQNICGLLKKKEELLNSLTRNSPQNICITEHHLIDEELEGITLHSYNFGAKFCRRTHKCGGVCIFIQDNVHCTNINMDSYSGFGGLEVVCWPLVPKFAGSNPAEAVGFFGRKNPQHAFLRRGSKAVCPMSCFTACKGTQK